METLGLRVFAEPSVGRAFRLAASVLSGKSGVEMNLESRKQEWGRSEVRDQMFGKSRRRSQEEMKLATALRIRV